MENSVIIENSEGNAALNTVATSGDNPTQRNSVFTVDNAGNLAYRTVVTPGDSALADKVELLCNPPIISARIAQNTSPVNPIARSIGNFDDVVAGDDWLDPVQGVINFAAKPSGLYSVDIYAYLLNNSQDYAYEVEIEQFVSGVAFRLYAIYVPPAASNMTGYACFSSGDIMNIDSAVDLNSNFTIKTAVNAGTNVILRNFTLVVKRVGDPI